MAKKVLIAVLVILTVFSASVFARDGFENYSGITAGYGFSNATYTYGLEFKESSNPLVFSAVDYAFFNQSVFGAFAEIGVTIPLNIKYIGTPDDRGVAGVFCALGPAFKFELGNSFSLLLDAGFHFYGTSSSNNYVTLKRSYFGAGVGVQASYKLGRYFAVNLGATCSYYFANYGKAVSLSGYTDDISYTSYSEFRVLPKIAGYYVY